MLTPCISLRNQQTSCPVHPSRLFSLTRPSPTRPRSRLRSSSHSLLPSGTCSRKQRRSAAPLQRFRPRWSASQLIPDLPRPMGEFDHHQWAALLQARKINPFDTDSCKIMGPMLCEKLTHGSLGPCNLWDSTRRAPQIHIPSCPSPDHTPPRQHSLSIIEASS
jgi:hypothetical protein